MKHFIIIFMVASLMWLGCTKGQKVRDHDYSNFGPDLPGQDGQPSADATGDLDGDEGGADKNPQLQLYLPAAHIPEKVEFDLPGGKAPMCREVAASSDGRIVIGVCAAWLQLFGGPKDFYYGVYLYDRDAGDKPKTRKLSSAIEFQLAQAVSRGDQFNVEYIKGALGSPERKWWPSVCGPDDEGVYYISFTEPDSREGTLLKRDLLHVAQYDGGEVDYVIKRRCDNEIKRTQLTDGPDGRCSRVFYSVGLDQIVVKMLSLPPQRLPVVVGPEFNYATGDFSVSQSGYRLLTKLDTRRYYIDELSSDAWPSVKPFLGLNVLEAVLSGDAKRIVYSFRGPGAYPHLRSVKESDGSDVLELLNVALEIDDAFAVSDDGKKVLFFASDGVFAWDALSGKQIQVGASSPIQLTPALTGGGEIAFWIEGPGQIMMRQIDW